MKILGKQSILNSVAVIAYLGHASQVDKAGTPYKFHIAKVVDACKSFDAKVVAYLHDICEDLHIEMKALKETGLLTEKQIDAINLLNKRNSDYDLEEYYRWIKRNEIAREVKIADLRDNMDLTRFTEAGILIDEKIMKKYSTYKKWLEYLLD